MNLTREQKMKLRNLRLSYNDIINSMSGEEDDLDSIIFDLLNEENIEKILNSKNDSELSSSFQKDEKYYM
jgi:hypothetical protein